jgi:hypothetical protein
MSQGRFSPRGPGWQLELSGNRQRRGMVIHPGGETRPGDRIRLTGSPRKFISTPVGADLGWPLKANRLHNPCEPRA